MPTTKTMTPLSEMPKVLVTQCTAVLPNHMQCWRAGDFLVTVTETTLAVKKGDADTVKNINTYQLCRAHAQGEAQADSQPVIEPPK